MELPSKLEIEKDEVATDAGSASDGDTGYDSESSEESSVLSAAAQPFNPDLSNFQSSEEGNGFSVTAKPFYPPPPGL